jgi:hypothetical protein
MRKKQGASSFSGEILVAARIIDYLSSGLYNNPAACLKELINNSYDADATQVKVFVQPDADRIIIDDNGIGMSRDEFVRNFQRIAETHKRDSSESTPSGRPTIGKIGIGFIAANEICDTLEIESTKAGSTEKINVAIHFDKMRLDIGERRRQGGDVAKGDYFGEVSDAGRDEHYTRVFLTKVRGPARTLLVGASRSSGIGGLGISLYGLSAESISAFLAEGALSDWSDLDPYSETMMRVGLNVPVRYYDSWLPADAKRKVERFARETGALDFVVFYDGTDLHKPIVLKPEAGKGHIIATFSYTGSAVSARGYFYAQHGVIKPRNLHGLLIRIRHAAIGEYDPSFLGFPASRSSLLQHWISAEIWAGDQLEDAMNIDRRTLRESHPAFAELQKAIHEKLAEILAQIRSSLYLAENRQRRKQKAEETVDEVKSLITATRQDIGPQAARNIKKIWDEAGNEDEARQRILQKLSVVEVYELVMDVARQVLTPAQAARFLEELTRRLLGTGR